MFTAFVKNLSDIDAGDFQALIDGGAAENERVEFKRQFPAKSDDPWNADCRFGEYGRDQILSELVAFANAHGGQLLIGIEENSSDGAKRAKALTPVRDCHDLSDRILKAARDCVDPPLDRLQGVGVPIGDAGAGVVALRVDRSPDAPHRLESSRECFIRRADRTEKMTMREIQDLTLLTSRGMQDLDTRLQARRDEYESAIQDPEFSAPGFLTSVRMTAIPVWPITLPPVRRDSPSMPRMSNATIRMGNDLVGVWRPPFMNDQRPIIRGWRQSETLPGKHWSYISREDGLSEIVGWGLHTPSPDGYRIVPPGKILMMLISILRTVEAMRTSAQAPSAEFVVDWEMRIFGDEDIRLGQLFGNDAYNDSLGEALPHRMPFPLLSIRSPDEFNGIIRRALQDLLSGVGYEMDLHPLQVEW